MAKWYFQYMHEGAGAAGITAAIVESPDAKEACWNFVHENHHSFYGGCWQASLTDIEESYNWVMWCSNHPYHTVHGCFKVPREYQDFNHGELWKLYQEIDVRTFFKDPPEVSLVTLREIERARVPKSMTEQIQPGLVIRKVDQSQVLDLSGGGLVPKQEPLTVEPVKAPVEKKTYYPRKLGL
jgi:hypothetical protein